MSTDDFIEGVKSKAQIDSQKAMREYLANFHAAFKAATGLDPPIMTPNHRKKCMEGNGLQYKLWSEQTYLGRRFYIIARRARLLPFGWRRINCAADLAELMKQ